MRLGFVSCGWEWFLFLRSARCTVGLSLTVDVLQTESQPNWAREKALGLLRGLVHSIYRRPAHLLAWGVFSPTQFSL
jgi:hypothetical protein